MIISYHFSGFLLIKVCRINSYNTSYDNTEIRNFDKNKKRNKTNLFVRNCTPDFVPGGRNVVFLGTTHIRAIMLTGYSLSKYYVFYDKRPSWSVIIWPKSSIEKPTCLEKVLSVLIFPLIRYLRWKITMEIICFANFSQTRCYTRRAFISNKRRIRFTKALHWDFIPFIFKWLLYVFLVYVLSIFNWFFSARTKNHKRRNFSLIRNSEMDPLMVVL